MILIQGPGPLILMFAKRFKWAPYNSIEMTLNLNGPPTIVLIQEPDPSI